jgi:hypothetical protein
LLGPGLFFSFVIFFTQRLIPWKSERWILLAENVTHIWEMNTHKKFQLKYINGRENMEDQGVVEE